MKEKDIRMAVLLGLLLLNLTITAVYATAGNSTLDAKSYDPLNKTIQMKAGDPDHLYNVRVYSKSGIQKYDSGVIDKLEHEFTVTNVFADDFPLSVRIEDRQSPHKVDMWEVDKMGNETGPSPALAVGGIVIQVDKFVLLAPYIGLASTITASVIVAVVYIKRKKE
jgi:hypothetical protein